MLCVNIGAFDKKKSYSYQSEQNGAILSAWDYTLCLAGKISSKRKQKLYNESLIGQACSVKILRVYGPRLCLGPYTRKKRTWPKKLQRKRLE